MLKLTCTVRSTIHTPSSVVRSTGEVRDAKTQVQVELEQPNGTIEIKKIKIPPETLRTWEDMKSEVVTVVVNIWASGGMWGFWLPDGSVPEPVDVAL